MAVRHRRGPATRSIAGAVMTYGWWLDETHGALVRANAAMRRVPAVGCPDAAEVVGARDRCLASNGTWITASWGDPGVVALLSGLRQAATAAPNSDSPARSRVERAFPRINGVRADAPRQRPEHTQTTTPTRSNRRLGDR